MRLIKWLEDFSRESAQAHNSMHRRTNSTGRFPTPQAVRIEITVRTWCSEGLDVFLAESAKEFRGWTGARTWRSLERGLTLSAEHNGSCVQLTWGLHDRLPDDEWHFEAPTDHAPGEEMRISALRSQGNPAQHVLVWQWLAAWVAGAVLLPAAGGLFIQSSLRHRALREGGPRALPYLRESLLQT
ncbi:DUF6228 family protein [Streptomyces sp. IMTB 2501]|uniref:DUF6228 family protein n=1 Tax=Streptomyces sp. IMTB 2501 TaxID=1776340 RepID=UPI0015BCA768|nr:DUF6228 family protein [Streptomyces sp. IMTB 2501]